jgi:dihydroorotate dehydrogenase (NAD+) catalytic subunit
MIFAGASAVSVGTANFGNPTAAIKVKREICELLIERGFNSISEAVGVAHSE